MEHEKIERLNVLARKMKAEGLTEEEKAEQTILRREYLDGFRANMEAVLQGLVIKNPHVTKRKLTKKKPQ